MKCPQCRYDYAQLEIGDPHYDLQCAHIEKHGKCIACVYEGLPKDNRVSFGQFLREARERLEEE